MREGSVWKKDKESEINNKGKKIIQKLLLTATGVFSTIGQYETKLDTRTSGHRNYVTRAASCLHTSSFTASTVVQLANTTAATMFRQPLDVVHPVYSTA